MNWTDNAKIESIWIDHANFVLMARSWSICPLCTWPIFYGKDPFFTKRTHFTKWTHFLRFHFTKWAHSRTWAHSRKWAHSTYSVPLVTSRLRPSSQMTPKRSFEHSKKIGATSSCSVSLAPNITSGASQQSRFVDFDVIVSAVFSFFLAQHRWAWP